MALSLLVIACDDSDDTNTMTDSAGEMAGEMAGEAAGEAAGGEGGGEAAGEAMDGVTMGEEWVGPCRAMHRGWVHAAPCNRHENAIRKKKCTCAFARSDQNWHCRVWFCLVTLTHAG